MKNLNLIFNKLYYEQLGGLFNGKAGEESFSSSLKKHNDTIFGAVFDHERDYIRPMGTEKKLIFRTTYPGLLIGTGNPHGAHKNNEDINMGFSFDYVSGQPYIPGSSVKGILSSCMSNSPEIISEILGDESVNVNKLITEIFDSEKDVFLDAVLYDSNDYGLIIGEDYITPHKDAVKNPVPIRLIKILPDVRFEFRFILKDGILSADEKLELFKNLIEIFGVGAKTNVGYGVLTEDHLNGEILPKKKVVSEMKSTVYNGKTSHTDNNGFDRRRQNPNNSKQGKCQKCGKPTRFNEKKGEPHRLCYECFNKK